MHTTSQQKSRGLGATLLAVLLILVLMLAPTPADTQAAANIQPELLAMAAEQPNAVVAVIVQKAGESAQVEDQVAELGGVVTKDLHLINSFAAEMTAVAAAQLAQDARVKWVSLDAKVISTSATVEIMRDEFNTRAYNNNDGSTNWAGSWTEINDDNRADGGRIKISSGELLIKDDNRGLQRAAALSGVETATLSFDYRRESFDDINDYVSIEVSADGGATWTELDRFAGKAKDSNLIPVSYDITTYATADTLIRFYTSSSLGRKDKLHVDNLQIEYSISASPPPPPPPSPPPSALPGLEELDGIELNHDVQDDLYTFVDYNYKFNSGDRNWSSPWMEINDDDDPASGEVYVGYAGGLKRHLITRNSSDWNPVHGIWRTVDLSGATAAKLTFQFKRAVLEADDYLAVEISNDGGATWFEADRFYGGNNDPDFISVSYNISPFIAPETAVRFISNFNDAGNYDYDLAYVYKTTIEFNAPDMPMPPNTYLETLNVPAVWDMGIKGDAIGIAIIDSGIAPDDDFKKEPDDYSSASMRLMTNVSFNMDSSIAIDTYGHGTHVASIAAGMGMKSDGYYKGIAPHAKLLSLKVSDDNGMAYESDVVAALQWIYDLKGTAYESVYNIRVVNMSINSTVEQSYHDSPLNTAVEILWLNDIVVVASAGNWVNGYYNTINAAPANDPFIITVGASDERGNSDRSDDYMAIYSSRGTTMDGYTKPDILAPGTDIIGTLSDKSWWRNDHPDRFVENLYFRASGSSMAAPMVSGAVALLLQNEPDLTPDQVKYRLTHTGDTINTILSGEYPYLDVYDAIITPTTESANQGVVPNMLLAKMALVAYWASANGAEAIDWSAVDWDAVNWDAVDWDAVDWNSVNWGSVNWGSVNWGSVNWGSVNWGSVNWGSVNWGSVNWGSVNWGSVNWGSVNWGSASWDD